MNISEHARILSAYLTRLTHKDLERILEADAECWRAQANYGTNEQLRVQDKFRAVVLEAMGNMLTHDRDNIAQVVQKVVNREAA
jgi:hypothetical protein